MVSQKKSMNDASDTLIDTVPSLFVCCDGRRPNETYNLLRKVYTFLFCFTRKSCIF